MRPLALLLLAAFVHAETTVVVSASDRPAVKGAAAQRRGTGLLKTWDPARKRGSLVPDGTTREIRGIVVTTAEELKAGDRVAFTSTAWTPEGLPVAPRVTGLASEAKK